MDFLKIFLKKLMQKKPVKSEEPIEKEEADAFEQTGNYQPPESRPNGKSLLNPTKPGIKTIKTKWVYITVIVLCAVFVFSFIFAVKKKDSGNLPDKNHQIANAATDNAQTNRSYADLLGNKNQKGANGNVPGNNPNGTMPQNVNGLNANGQYPQNGYQNQQAYIPNANYDSTRSAIPPVPQGTYGYVPTPYLGSNATGQNPQNQAAAAAGAKDAYLRSPIGFNIGSSTANAAAAVGADSYNSSSDNTLTAGSLIPVTLLTGIVSDLPGDVVAQVRQNVYDSISGNTLLIPQGTRVLGSVNNGSTGSGQDRIAVTWKRMILPNGYSVNLGSMSGVDNEGYPGLKDRVDNHEGKIIGATLLTSILSAGAQMAVGNTSNDSQNFGQLATSGAAGAIMNAGSKLLDRSININPTITISPGTVFNIFVNQDLILKAYE